MRVANPNIDPRVFFFAKPNLPQRTHATITRNNSMRQRGLWTPSALKSSQPFARGGGGRPHIAQATPLMIQSCQQVAGMAPPHEDLCVMHKTQPHPCTTSTPPISQPNDHFRRSTAAAGPPRQRVPACERPGPDNCCQQPRRCLSGCGGGSDPPYFLFYVNQKSFRPSAPHPSYLVSPISLWSNPSLQQNPSPPQYKPL